MSCLCECKDRSYLCWGEICHFEQKSCGKHIKYVTWGNKCWPLNIFAFQLNYMLDLQITHVINPCEQEIRFDPTKFTKQGICYKGFICKVYNLSARNLNNIDPNWGRTIFSFPILVLPSFLVQTWRTKVYNFYRDMEIKHNILIINSDHNVTYPDTC